MRAEPLKIIESEATQKSRRVMELCNACRYCEGFCAVFPAMTQRRVFSAEDIDYLANLCHNCTACYHACQYAPPHEFSINVPKVLSESRVESYQKYAWPGFMGRLFNRNGLFMSMAMAVSIALVLVLVFALQDSAVLFAEHKGAGAFYQVISHGLMVAVAGGSFLFSGLAMLVGFMRFYKATQGGASPRFSIQALIAALKDTASLKYLGGGHGEGCNTADESFSNMRRIYHHFTMWGFILCFCATSVATVYEYGLGIISPFPFFSLPVLLGTIGGIGLLIGPVGLVWVKLQTDKRPMLISRFGMDYAFLALLFFISLTGMALLALRETSAMGVLLAVHLGFVLAFFIAMPYSKFVHSVYRFAALLVYSQQKESAEKPAAS